jgi:hypothetical protein
MTENVRYELHGKIYSTKPTGEHFYTVCYKTIKGIVRIDNLRRMEVLSTDEMESIRLLKSTGNTVFAYYKKL